MSIAEVHRASEAKDLDLSHDALPVERTLGIQWDTDMDAFTFSMKLQDKPMTRRCILSVVNSVYDPLGFLAPVVLLSKLLLKGLCKVQHGWDESLGKKHAEDWQKWKEDVTHLTDFHVSRCLKPPDFGCTAVAQSHHFSDASEYAYGTVSYLLLENKQGGKHCLFLMKGVLENSKSNRKGPRKAKIKVRKTHGEIQNNKRKESTYLRGLGRCRVHINPVQSKTTVPRGY